MTQQDEDNSLDELLATARWPQPRSGAVARLESALRARSAHWIGYSATAAAVAACLVLGFERYRMTSPELTRRQVLVETVQREPIAPPLLVAREPTAYERLMLISKTPSGEAAASTRVPRNASALSVSGAEIRQAAMRPASWPAVSAMILRADSQTLAQLSPEPIFAHWREQAAAELLRRGDAKAIAAYLQLMCEPDGRAAAMAAASRCPTPPLEQLLARFDDPRVRVRMAAAQVLGTVCKGNAVATLIAMAQDGPHHREAMAALIACGDPMAVGFVKRNREVPVYGSSHDAEVASIRSELAAVSDQEAARAND